MLIKKADDKSGQLAELKRLEQEASGSVRKKIQNQIKFVQAGLSAEKDVAWRLDNHFRDVSVTAVLHDLRLEIDGRVAQIDHILLNILLLCICVETKSFHAGVKINEEGEFLRYNAFTKSYDGMASPIEQNKRHISVLYDAFKLIDMPRRLGFRLNPKIESAILVKPEARIIRPERNSFDTSMVLKADQFPKYWDRKIDEMSKLNVMKVILPDQLSAIAKQLKALHKPALVPNYRKQFGLPENGGSADPRPGNRKPSAARPPKESREPTPEVPSAPQAATEAPVCKDCGSRKLTILHGRFGYYFKCVCGANTTIKVDCGHEGHKERLRKDGLKFFRECKDCGSSALFYENEPEPEAAAAK